MQLFNFSAQYVLPVLTATTLLSGSFAVAHESLESTRTAPVFLSLQCIHDYLSNKKDGLEGVNYGFKWLTNLVANTKDKRDESRYIKYSQMTTEQILNECSQKNRSSERSRFSPGELAVHLGKIQKQTEDIKATWENQLGNLQQIRREAAILTFAFSQPRSYCYSGGLSAGAAAVLAVSAQTKVGYCKSLSGKQWLSLELGLGTDIDVKEWIPYGGASVSVEFGASHLPDDGFFISSAPVFNGGGGAALAASAEVERESGRTLEGQLDPQQIGAGIGIFAWNTVGRKVGIKILPLLSDSGFIVDYFDDIINIKDHSDNITRRVEFATEARQFRYFVEAGPEMLKKEIEDYEMFNFYNNPMP